MPPAYSHATVFGSQARNSGSRCRVDSSAAAAGRFDMCFPDTHNSTSGNCGGMFILPDPVALNIYGDLDQERSAAAR